MAGAVGQQQSSVMKGLRFGFIKDSYLRLLGSQRGQARVRFSLYFMVGMVSFGLAF